MIRKYGPRRLTAKTSVKKRFIDRADGSDPGDARIDEEDVNAPVLFSHVFDQAFGSLRVACVRGDHLDVRHFFARSLNRGSTRAGDYDRCPFGVKALSGS